MTISPQEKTSTEAKPYEKCHESDGEMLVRISKKFAVLITVILLFDTIIDTIIDIREMEKNNHPILLVFLSVFSGVVTVT